MPFKDVVINLIEQQDKLVNWGMVTSEDVERLAEAIDRAAKDSVELTRYYSDGEGKELRKPI